MQNQQHKRTRIFHAALTVITILILGIVGFSYIPFNNEASTSGAASEEGVQENPEPIIEENEDEEVLDEQTEQVETEEQVTQTDESVETHSTELDFNSILENPTEFLDAAAQGRMYNTQFYLGMKVDNAFISEYGEPELQDYTVGGGYYYRYGNYYIVAPHDEKTNVVKIDGKVPEVHTVKELLDAWGAPDYHVYNLLNTQVELVYEAGDYQVYFETNGDEHVVEDIYGGPDPEVTKLNLNAEIRFVTIDERIDYQHEEHEVERIEN